MKSCALRRIEILQILCKRKKEKIENLAEELCVSKRTICNDLEALSNSFPIYTQTGTYGGIFIFDGFTLGMKYLSHDDKIVVNLTWKEVAKRISDLITKGEYLIGDEREKYAQVLRFREERENAEGDNALIKVIADQYVEYGASETYSGKFGDYPHFLEDYVDFFNNHIEEIAKEFRLRHEVEKVEYGKDFYGERIEV